MPATQSAVNKRGIKIDFFEDTHKYVSNIEGKEVLYTSGTTFVGKFFPVFDPDGSILRNKAKKLGITPEELKRQWDDKKDHSCVFGTNVHAICENIMKNKPYDLIFDNEHDHKVSVIAESTAKKVKEKMEIIEAEKIVFDETLKIPIAGTIDLLGRSRKDGRIIIGDWKTNEKIETGNPFHKFGLGVLSNIPDNSYYHYCLQLSLYQHLLVSGGFYPDGTKFSRYIFHLTDSGSKVYNLPDMTYAIKQMLNSYR